MDVSIYEYEQTGKKLFDCACGYLLQLQYIFVMLKGNINFKEMRKKVIQPSANSENIPANPLSKLSFRAIKKHQHPQPSPSSYQVDVPRRILQSNRSNQSSREDCNKFSVLLESKGYSNSGSARKDYPGLNRNMSELSFKTMQKGMLSKCETSRDKQEPQTDKTTQKCREIKEKKYFSSRKNLYQLNSLSKLKGKLISPLKKKTVSQPEVAIRFKTEAQPRKKTEPMSIFQHESILSDHDLVNMSKTHESVDFDMSPCL